MKFALPVLVCLFSLALSAQDPYGIPINKRSGLPSNEVYSLFQDSKGFIWMATGSGLCRYDGFEFKTYSLSLHRSLTGTVIKEDKYGRIWYITFDGWMHYVEDDTLKALPGQNKPAGSLEYALTNNSLIVPSSEGVDLFELSTLKLKKSFKLKQGFFISSVQWNNSLCIADDSMNIIDESGTHTKYPLPPENIKAGSMVAQPNGDLLILHRNKGQKKAYRFNGKEFIPAFNLPESFIHSSQFCDNRFWFFTESGIYTYTPNGNPLNGGKPLFEKEGMTCVMKDIEQNIWLGSKDNAILLINDFKQHLILKESPPIQIEIFADTLFYSLRGGQIFQMRLNRNDQPVALNESPGQSLYMLTYDTLNNYLIGTSPQGYVIRQGNKIVNAKNSALKAIAPLNENFAVIATSGLNGLMKLTDKPDPIWDPMISRNRTLPVAQYEMINLTGNMRGRDVAVMPNTQQAWIATNQGLFSVKPSGIHEITNNGEPIICRKLAAWENTLYGLSINGDLICIRNTTQFNVLSGRFQIPHQIEQMHNFGNNLALVHNGAILILNMNAPNHDIITIKTPATDIYDIDYYNGKIYVATTNGLLLLNYTVNNVTDYTPMFNINSVLVNNVKTELKSLLLLNNNQNQIEVNYSVLAFGVSRFERLYYRLNNQPWVLCENGSRSLKLAALAPGNYTLSFRFGEKEITPVSVLRFKISQPWWKTPVAIMIWILIIAALIYLVYRRLLYLQDRKNKEITERLELERNFDRSVLTAIRSQMNPHFFFNALNTIQSYIFENDRQNAGNYLSKFSKLTRMILEMSACEQITLAQETDALQLYLELERARFDTDFEFEMHYESNVEREMIRIPPMILQPYVENAVKHGLLHKKGEKKLTIRFRREQQLLITEIDDNGIGRKRSIELNRIKSEHHASFATEANQKRLELLNKGRSNKLAVEYTDKTDENGQASGTTVCITIPF
ncbi:MAG: histidine kinase [Bacteroidota bacterium]|jgi:two-component sensor histidine kinase